MKYCYFLTLFIFLIVSADAQNNFKPGFIVNGQKDTLKGFIDYREWDNNPESVVFKGANEPVAKRYEVQNINAFAVTGSAYFEKYTLPISLDAVDVTKVFLKTRDSTIVKPVFLKVIATGNVVGLYSYTDAIKTRFFIKENQDQSIKELTYHVYYTESNSGLVNKITRYKTELQYIAQKNGLSTTSLSGLISSANYNKADILKVVQAINKNNGEQFTTKSQFGTRFFAGLAYTYNNLKFVGAGTPVQSGLSANSSAPAINAGIDLIFNKSTQRLFLRIEAEYKHTHYNFISNDPVNQNEYQLDIKQNIITVSPKIVYNIYSKEDTKFFISAGLALNFASYNDHYKINYRGGISTTDVTDNPDFNKSWIALPVKAGLQLNKKLEINIGYTLPSSIVDYSGYSAKITTYEAGVKYLFGN